MRIIAVLASVLAASALAACGGGGDTTVTRIAAKPAEEVEVGPLRMTVDSTTSFDTGRHANATGFGHEAPPADLRRAAAEFHDYVAAVVNKNWAKACLHVSERLARRLTSGSPDLQSSDCATILGAIRVPETGASEYESSSVEAAGLRVDGERGFLLYGAAAAPYFIPVAMESGEWKVGALAGTSFYD